jgi:uroporphyrinogen-III synthase
MKPAGGILVTRPLGQQALLKARLDQENIPAWFIPTIAITPINPTPDQIEQTLQGAHWLIFPSGNAVEQGWSLVASRMNHFTQLAAVGKITAEKLHNVSQNDVIYPQTTQDSEGLLETPEFQNIQGQKIVLVKGEGGRATLAQELEARGAKVESLNCYRRELPELNQELLKEALAHNPLVLSQSAESIGNLKNITPEDLWQKLKSCSHAVTHPRIADHARNLGINQVFLIDNGIDPLIELWQIISSGAKPSEN